MNRQFLVGVVAVLLCACGPNGIGLSGEDEAASGSEGEVGDGDGDPAPGDGDGEPAPGDGDGEPTTGDGDGDPAPGDGDGEPTTGDGDGDLPPPNCDEPEVIDGTVVLDEDSTPAEFAALSCVIEITGDLDIDNTEVSDLEFVSALQRVGGRLRITGNDGLTDLAGLDALEEVGAEIWIGHNAGLLSLEGLGSLHAFHRLNVSANTSLVSLAGLAGAIHLHAANPNYPYVDIRIDHNDSLTSLDELAAITELTVEQPLHLRIVGNSQLGGDLSGLSPWIADEHQLILYVTDNALASLAGLEALTTASDIHLLGLSGDYPSLAGLDNLTTVTGVLEIGACLCINGEVQSECHTDFGLEPLESLDGLESLVSVGYLRIWGNESLVDIDALAGLQTAGTLEIEDNPLLPQAAVDSLVASVEIAGDAWVSHNGTGDDPICGFVPQ